MTVKIKNNTPLKNVIGYKNTILKKKIDCETDNDKLLAITLARKSLKNLTRK